MRTIVMGAPLFNPEPTATAQDTRRTVAAGSGLNERKRRGQRGVTWWLCTLAVLISVAPASAADKASKVTYDDHVVPILREKCFACHNQDRKSGGLRLNNF